MRVSIHRRRGVASFEISWGDLGVSAETVRRSAPLLKHSPVYPLMQAHMARLCAGADALRHPDVGPHIGHATVQLAKALIASAEGPGPRACAILNEALYTRIVEYILLHLADQSLTPERIAAAHDISLRQLYRIWSHSQLGVAEWIIAERLARAAAALTDDHQRHTPIWVVAHSLGFKDAAHFSRRFRAAYGMPPRVWRHDSGALHPGNTGVPSRS